jgi:hypothetical protein
LMPQLHSYDMCSFQIDGLKPSNFPDAFSPDKDGLKTAELIEAGVLFWFPAFAEYGSGPLPPQAVKIMAVQAGPNRVINSLLILAAFFKFRLLLAE